MGFYEKEKTKHFEEFSEAAQVKYYLKNHFSHKGKSDKILSDSIQSIV